MSIQSLIIDCDPGVDDAVALFLAFAAPELKVLAVTTVGGNVPGALTQRNARMVRQIAGRDDVPVFGGAERPLKRPPAGAGAFHGPEGLGDLEPFEPTGIVGDGPAANAIVDLVMRRPEGSVAVAVLGPMTNLALALRRERRLAERLGPVVVMGGARSEGGNITPSAEFNIWADPDAAAVVFGSGCRVVAFGLDATHQVRATEDRIAAVEAIDGAAARATASMLRFSQRVEREIVGWPTFDWGAPLHDPCPIAWLIRPELFETRPCRVEVETASDLTRGHTAVEFRVDPATARHRWATAADAQGVFDLIVETLKGAA
ncbi:MAG: nucleoside hydrolase [Candidatus Brevundimonas colombiensis]|uniref:Nucleoside hydrolase n=1 Tax=Candidatus Brevundimonas colombiensis TaxID=3121376 RepID=A0AAJ5X1G1_9CAUL|nr:nucleoside hydrolase [Brevundimonas sp.]WEK40437.1 MAG: nucleoside hydrolase [Brevundimonas sp.]